MLAAIGLTLAFIVGAIFWVLVGLGVIWAIAWTIRLTRYTWYKLFA